MTLQFLFIYCLTAAGLVGQCVSAQIVFQSHHLPSQQQQSPVRRQEHRHHLLQNDYNQPQSNPQHQVYPAHRPLISQQLKSIMGQQQYRPPVYKPQSHQQYPQQGFRQSTLNRRFRASITLLGGSLELLIDRLGSLEGKIDRLITGQLLKTDRIGVASNYQPQQPINSNILINTNALHAGSNTFHEKLYCDQDFVKVGNDCIYISVAKHHRVDWQAAQQECMNRGAVLAAPETAEEFSSLSTYLCSSSATSSYAFWLGGLYPGVAWHWVDTGSLVDLNRDLWTYSRSNKHPGARSDADLGGLSSKDSIERENITSRSIENKKTEDIENGNIPTIQNIMRKIKESLYMLGSENVDIDEKYEEIHGRNPSEREEIVYKIRNYINSNMTIELNNSTFNSTVQSNETKSSEEQPSSIVYYEARHARKSNSSEPIEAMLQPDTLSVDTEGRATVYHNVVNEPWDTKNGRCLMFHNVVENGEPIFRYAADQCGYKQYYICAKKYDPVSIYL